MERRERGRAYDRGHPRGRADLLDYLQQGSTGAAPATSDGAPSAFP